MSGDMESEGVTGEDVLFKVLVWAKGKQFMNRTVIALAGTAPAQRAYYLTVLQPMWQGQVSQLVTSLREYRWHLLSAACLAEATGPGISGSEVAEFCRAWQLPLTTPLVNPIALIRRVGKMVGGGPVAALDPTGAVQKGIKVMAALAPLLGRIEIRNAMLMALNERLVPRADQTAVMSILQQAGSPPALAARIAKAKDQAAATWQATLALAEKMEQVRKEVGLEEGQ